MKAKQSRLLSSLLLIAAPAASDAAFSPRRQFYSRLNNVRRSCVRVHSFNSMDIAKSHLQWLQVPGFLTERPNDIETMQWVLDNQDHCYSHIGV